jgi:hypothetical protein
MEPNHNLKETILIGTIVRTLPAIQGQKLALPDLRQIVKKAAVDSGATGELLATLVRHLPQLILATRLADLDAAEASLSLPLRTTYENLPHGETVDEQPTIEKGSLPRPKAVESPFQSRGVGITEMDSREEHNQLIRALIKDVAHLKASLKPQITSLQSAISQLTLTEGKLHALRHSCGIGFTKEETQEFEAVATADGRPIYAAEVGTLSKDDFDIILDIPAQKLWVRANPRSKSSLLERNIKRFREKRRRLLAYMLKHSKVRIGVHNISSIYQVDKYVPENTLAKAIEDLRRLFLQSKPAGPYILNTDIWSKSGRREEFIGKGYVMNSKCHYLVVLENFANHQEFIAQFIEKS